MLGFNLNYGRKFDDDREIYSVNEDPPEDDRIYDYIDEADDRSESDGLYSALLDSILHGLDEFAQDPAWTDGDSPFKNFEELMTRDTHPEWEHFTPVIWDRTKVEEAVALIKEAVATMILGFDI